MILNGIERVCWEYLPNNLAMDLTKIKATDNVLTARAKTLKTMAAMFQSQRQVVRLNFRFYWNCAE
jgi:uncharacterized protein YcfL